MNFICFTKFKNSIVQAPEVKEISSRGEVPLIRE